MKNNIRRDFPFILVFVVVSAFLLVWVLDHPLEQLRIFFADNFFWTSAILYFLIITVSTIFSPITVVPAIPFVSKILGSQDTFFLTLGGIFVGSTIAFYLARTYGRKFIIKIFSEDLLKNIEKRTPKNMRFLHILFFRFFTPPNGFSYFLGIHSKINYKKYFIATLLGVMPMTYILSYGADAITKNDRILFFLLVFSIFLIIISNIFFKFLNSKKAKLITHSHNFHLDDIFAAATLSLFLEKRGISYKIIRTRDVDKLKKYKIEAKKKVNTKLPVFIFDVGGEYDEENNIFDHHQKNGALRRESGIEYSSFGLVWKKYGEKLCGGKKIAEKLEQNIVIGVDANDTGAKISNPCRDFSLYGLPSLKNSFFPISGKEKDFDIAFQKVLKIFKQILINEIKWSKKKIEDEKSFRNIYSQSKDKRIVWIEEDISVGKYFPDFPELLFLLKKKEDGVWVITGTKKEKCSNEVKLKMPESWGGLEGEELEKVSGIKGIKFCHAGRWIAAANNKEAVEKMIKKILED